MTSTFTKLAEEQRGSLVKRKATALLRDILLPIGAGTAAGVGSIKLVGHLVRNSSPKVRRRAQALQALTALPAAALAVSLTRRRNELATKKFKEA